MERRRVAGLRGFEEMRRREAQGIAERLGTLRLQTGPAGEATRATCFGLPYAARYGG